MDEKDKEPTSQAVVLFEDKISKYMENAGIGSEKDAHALALLVVDLLGYHPDEVGKLATDTLTPAFLAFLNLLNSSHPDGKEGMENKAVELMKSIDTLMENEPPAVIIFTAAEYLLNSINRTMKAMEQHNTADDLPQNDLPE
jgi:hypothetical protein